MNRNESGQNAPTGFRIDRVAKVGIPAAIIAAGALACADTNEASQPFPTETPTPQITAPPETIFDFTSQLPPEGSTCAGFMDFYRYDVPAFEEYGFLTLTDSNGEALAYLDFNYTGVDTNASNIGITIPAGPSENILSKVDQVETTLKPAIEKMDPNEPEVLRSYTKGGLVKRNGKPILMADEKVEEGSVIYRPEGQVACAEEYTPQAELQNTQ